MDQSGKQNEIRALMDQVIQVRYSDLALEKECCERLLVLATQSNDNYALAFAHTYLGDYYVATGDSILCDEQLLYSRNYCTTYQLNDLLLINHLLSGVLCENVSNLQKAFDHYMEGLALAEQFRDDVTKGNIYNNIASAFSLLGDHQEAIKYFNLAYRLFEMLGDRVSNRCRIVLLGNMAETCCALNDIDHALTYISKAESISVDNPIDASPLYVAKTYVALLTEPAKIRKLVDELFAMELEKCEDVNLAFEVLYLVGMKVVQAGDGVYAQRILSLLEAMCDDIQILHVQQFQMLRVEYAEHCCEQYHEDCVYKQYYRATKKNDENSRCVWAAGLKAKIGLAETMREKEEVQAHSKLLEAEAYLDEVTQVYNRKYLSCLVEKAGQEDKDRRACIAMIDLDYFKEFNDTYGHLGGDLALRTVASCLCENAPEGTVVGRYGGDEFIALSFDTTDAEMGRYFEAVRLDLANRAIAHKNSRCASKLLTLSIGYCSAEVCGEKGFQELIQQADRALYLAKYKGRDRMVCSELGD